MKVILTQKQDFMERDLSDYINALAGVGYLTFADNLDIG